jgi:hypothetical protein
MSDAAGAPVSAGDGEVRRITAEVGRLMGELTVNIDALKALILTPPDMPPETDERLVQG